MWDYFCAILTICNSLYIVIRLADITAQQNKTWNRIWIAWATLHYIILNVMWTVERWNRLP
jgi:hypothetical protein